MSDEDSGRSGSDEEAEDEEDAKERELAEERLAFAARLREALRSVDQDASGELNAFEFRSLYRTVFPGVQIDDKLLEHMFSDIDKDGSGSVEPEELLSYLDVSAKEIVSAKRKRPRTLRRWVWYAVGSEDVDWHAGGDLSTREKTGSHVLVWWRILSQVVIIISVCNVMMESLPRYQNYDGGADDRTGLPGTDATAAIEGFCIMFFTTEFVAYLLTFPYTCCPRSDEDSLSILWCVDTWIHLLSIVPWYLERLSAGSSASSVLVAFRITRLLRVLRILRTLKLTSGRFSRIPALGEALKNSAMSLIMLFNLIVITCALSASCIFMAETHDAIFDFEAQIWYRNSNSSYIDAGAPLMFQSIPDALWWALVTVTTVGYGDKSPVTELGRAIASVTMLWSICMMAYPITILSSVFQTLADEEREVATRRDFCQSFYEGIKIWLDRIEADPLSQTQATIGFGKTPTSPAVPLSEPQWGTGGAVEDVLAGTLGGTAMSSGDVLQTLAPVLRLLESIQTRLDRIETATTARQYPATDEMPSVRTPALPSESPRQSPKLVRSVPSTAQPQEMPPVSVTVPVPSGNGRRYSNASHPSGPVSGRRHSRGNLRTAPAALQSVHSPAYLPMSSGGFDDLSSARLMEPSHKKLGGRLRRDSRSGLPLSSSPLVPPLSVTSSVDPRSVQWRDAGSPAGSPHAYVRWGP